MKPSKIMTQYDAYKALSECHSQVIQSGFDAVWKELDASCVSLSRRFDPQCAILGLAATEKYAREKLVYLKTLAAFEGAKQKNFHEYNGNGEGSVNLPAPNQWRAEAWVM